VEIQDGDIDKVEEFGVILDRLTTGEEDDDFLLCITTEEGKEEEESFICLTNNVSLFQSLNSGVFHVCIDVDIERFWTEGDAGEVFNFGGLGC
jgi:hypothetical protein